VADLVAVRGSPLAERAQAAGVRVYTVPHPGARLRAALRLRAAGYDVVHCHDAHGLTAAWLAGACLHNVVAARRVAYPLSSSRRYRRATRIIAVSRFVAASVRASGLPAEQVEVIYDGVLLPPPSERSPGPPRVGCVGYLLPEKGQEALIRALPMIREKYGLCRLVLAGDGPCRTRLQRLALELGVGPVVELAGLVEDVSEVYRALDVFLFPSLAEPLGSSLLAAMSHSLPVVAVARGAVPEVVEDGRNGLLVASPAPAAMAAAVVRLLDDPALAARLGAAARQTIEQHFTAQRMVEATLDLYQRL
jgi:glycosyltransferase involved in cell wall biosynthesis